MTPVEQLERETSTIIAKYSQRSNSKAFIQTLNTLLPFLGLFYLALETLGHSIWLSSGLILLDALFLVRIFMLMHDCGHKSLFNTPWLNNVFGFIYGVMCGMPQYVWSRHHAYHHTTNGNWSRYRGPLSTLSTEEYAALSPTRQKQYRTTRNIVFAVPGAFMYFIFNPRFNWALGSIQFLFVTLSARLKNPRTPYLQIAVQYKSKFWANGREYRHMAGNNVALLGLWAILSAVYGAAAFFTVYLLVVSLAGAAGIIVFTIQHNFPDSYASDDAHWNYHQAALEGTSFLTFPKFINWFGADIAYHHVHHISSRIPNYNLARVHAEYTHLFEHVPRIKLRDVPRSFKYNLWDTQQRKIISIDDYEKQRQPA